jgi:hypothetical protein
VGDRSKISSEGKYTRADFTCDKERNVYTSPNGKLLTKSSRIDKTLTLNYLAKQSHCAKCPLKSNCTTGQERRVSRDVNQEARDYAQGLMETGVYLNSSIQRKKIERLL